MRRAAVISATSATPASACSTGTRLASRESVDVLCRKGRCATLARLVLAILLALLPATAWGHHRGPHPTPLEVAEAMIPCLTEFSGRAYPITAVGAGSDATVLEAGEPAFELDRYGERERAARDQGSVYFLDSDPVRPPLTISFALYGDRYPEARKRVAVYCFHQVYPPAG